MPLALPACYVKVMSQVLRKLGEYGKRLLYVEGEPAQEENAAISSFPKIGDRSNGTSCGYVAAVCLACT